MTKKDDDLIEKAKKCLEKAMSRESENWKRAEDAIKFRALDQWPDQIKRDREGDPQGPRPCPVLDKTNQYVRQVINEERQNRAAIKIRPVDDKADKEVADIYTGIIRHIEDSSNALAAYTMAGEQAVDGGFGYWRILAEYCNPMSFDQDIKIKRIPNRFSVVLGPHTESTGADAQEGLIWEDMQRDDFKAQYPKAQEVTFEAGDSWSDKDTIRVAEYIRIEKTQSTVHMMDDGKVINDEKLKAINDELKAQGQIEFTPAKSRSTTIKKVKWYKINSVEILEERDLVGSYIPIVKVVGNELFMRDGKCRTSGMIETMMDPARLHNYAIAGFIENIALAPKAPWVAAAGQIANYAQDYKDANKRNVLLLQYDPIETESGHLLPPPQRTQPAGIPPGWQQLLLNTEHGVEGSVGMYGPSVGGPARERSGVALEGQKAQGMVGNFHFPDNLSNSVQQGGRILLEWIPKYYDTERVARMLGEDGIPDMAYLNPAQESAVQPRMDQLGREIGQSYNLNVGTYDVTVSTGPSWTSKRQEYAEIMSAHIDKNPGLISLFGDLYFRSLDSPYSDKMGDRAAVMLDPAIQKMEAGKDKKPIDPKVQAAMAQVEQASQMLEMKGQELQQAQQDIEKAGTQVIADRSAVQNEKQAVQAEKQAIASAKQVLSAETQTALMKIELAGRKLIDDIEELTEPLVDQLKQQSDSQQTNGTEEPKEPQIIVMQDPAIQEVLQGIAELTAQATQQMAETVNQALMGVAEAVSRPRQTTLMRDEQGNPTGSVSQ